MSLVQRVPIRVTVLVEFPDQSRPSLTMLVLADPDESSETEVTWDTVTRTRDHDNGTIIEAAPTGRWDINIAMTDVRILESRNDG